MEEDAFVLVWMRVVVEEDAFVLKEEEVGADLDP